MWEFFSRTATKARAKRARSGYRFRPHVEVLEDRVCPSGGKLQWSDPDVVNQADSVYSVLAQPSGKIVLVGSSSNTSTPTPPTSSARPLPWPSSTPTEASTPTSVRVASC
jgi:hypothetical protein